MHILATTSSSLDDLIEPVDLNQPRSDVVMLSFSASDLAGLEQAWRRTESTLPSLSAANLSELRHPMSVDLWIEKTAEHAKVILIRILGGAERWRYGVDQLSILARRRGIRLLLLPGECSDRDEKLEAASTVDRRILASALSFFREGGQENMGRLAGGLTSLANGETWPDIEAEPLPKAGFYRPGRGVMDRAEVCEGFPAGAPLCRSSFTAPCFWRQMLHLWMRSSKRSRSAVLHPCRFLSAA